MAIVGWGVEGAVAAKAMDVSQSDVGFHIRVIAEAGIWWIIIIPILIVAGFPFIHYIGVLFTDPLALLVVAGSGLAFGFCNVGWYKSFALLGLARGQGLGCLNALCAMVFILVFTGAVPPWTIILGGALCIVGILMMFFEKDENLETIRGVQEVAE
jgi:drug/metabolite transporter (DMT)-like permease